MKIENRIYNDKDVQLRAYTEGDKKFLEGYAAKYNVESRLIYEKNGKAFYEMIEPRAFESVLENDVYLTFNHSRDKVLARTINKTLTLNSDETGLFFRAELNNTTDSLNLYEMVSRGDVAENSFAFYVDNEGQKWERNAKGDTLRRISQISRLFDVSVVVNAAYPQTEVYARGFEEFENDVNTKETVDIESNKNLIDILDRMKK